KVRQIRGSPSMRNVDGYIDDGLPIMWTIKFGQAWNQQVLERSLQRARIQDMAAWQEVLEPIRERADTVLPDNRSIGYHMCMIIGYNETTEEVCISDSWGQAFEERWITVEEAEEINAGRMEIIDW
ncbi:MAG: hypothetical protein K9N51_00825, partial [Candidatus Pacebacteria bacterium]|nr:hypothetical protein [Candidatus Paceibacterota bacterium]